jgi:hypothetical protein
MPDKVQSFVRHVVPSIIRPLRVLWNEVIGFLFLAIAVVPSVSLVRDIRRFDGSPDMIFRIFLTGVFALTMAYFGVTSFLRARKLSRP